MWYCMLLYDPLLARESVQSFTKLRRLRSLVPGAVNLAAGPRLQRKGRDRYPPGRQGALGTQPRFLCGATLDDTETNTKDRRVR
jgi:hypothetical protein